ncbi:hypothetical protein [Paenibacillus apiarius]|uniref:Uncharacterized protein n=1 Tax=Paenibacillus apiarius TaxID=46240 RepID=A0ABT4DQU5_9BACL|nr:hypothetical protein [Paenibacillus apiarius]MCY9513298.1 hypothetical protein [Paenibacillus apiarius]MCY9519730.1 hypothetical protein [Paenibacillus apiarius]MCY9553214.1 hypothetical protein [Paenibacillus apiarius]MCY9557064.1 hypothetical protein [Paenibacillus apiarius]MCY9682195.1 hypothetical protein [Paenibacillus apiarius]
MKKYVSTLLVFALMLVFSTSAFAANGIGDTKESAISLINEQAISLFIEDSTDRDWFKWTNNTGVTKEFTAWNIPKDESDWESWRFALQISYNNGRSTGMMYAEPGRNQYFTGVQVPNGATIYLMVEKTKGAMSQYKVVLGVENI